MTTTIRSEATRSVVVINGVDRAAFNEDGSMELLTPAANPTGNDVPTAGQLPFTKEYVSTQQTISAGGLLTLPHNLAAFPKMVSAYLICTIAEHGYSVGDIIGFFFPAAATASNDNGVIILDATNISIRFGSASNPIMSTHKTSGAQVRLTQSSWKIIVRAYA